MLERLQKPAGTLKWYNLLSQEEKEKITSIAVRNRIQVMKEYSRDERTIREQRQNKMEKGKVHQEALKVKKRKKMKKFLNYNLLFPLRNLDGV